MDMGSNPGGTNRKNTLSVNVERDTVDAMGDAYRLLGKAIPDCDHYAEEVCHRNEAAFDLTGLGKLFLGANAGPQLPSKHLARPPILDSHKRSTHCRDLGDIGAVQLRICFLHRSEYKPETNQQGERRKRETRLHLTRTSRATADEPSSRESVRDGLAAGMVSMGNKRIKASGASGFNVEVIKSKSSRRSAVRSSAWLDH